MLRRWGLTAYTNDDVIVLAGKRPPYPLLERCGVSFDPALREGVLEVGERGSGPGAPCQGALLAL
ncbi:MAG: hypothetical protein R3E96_16060 [Planctomycetota bacterium]